MSEYIWKLKNKETGNYFPTFTYKTRSAARKAAKGRRFKGQYTPVKVTPVQATINEIERNTTSTMKQNVNKTMKLTKRSLGTPVHKAKPVHKYS